MRISNFRMDSCFCLAVVFRCWPLIFLFSVLNGPQICFGDEPPNIAFFC